MHFPVVLFPSACLCAVRSSMTRRLPLYLLLPPHVTPSLRNCLPCQRRGTWVGYTHCWSTETLSFILYAQWYLSRLILPQLGRGHIVLWLRPQ